MPTTRAYQDHNKKCRELAKQAESSEERDLLLKIAETWNWIAADDESDVAGRRNSSRRKRANSK
jgi:hypothetical protein